MKNRYSLSAWVLVCLSLLTAGAARISAQTNFGSVNVAGHGNTIVVTVGLLAPGTLGSISVLTEGALQEDFINAGGGTCAIGVTYPANATCTVKVTFSPSNAGTEYGGVLLNDESGNLLASAFMVGVGVGPQLVYTPGVQTAIGSGWVQPWGTAVDGAGNIYVANYPSSPNASGGSVIKQTFSGGSYAQSTIGSGIVGPTGIAIDGEGNVYIVDSSSRAVFKETPSPSGYIQSQISTSGLALPIGIAVDAVGNLYITDAAKSDVVKETVVGGSYVQTVIGSGLSSPTGIAVDGGGDVYVGDWGNHRVVMETPSSSGYLQSTLLSGIQETGGVGGSIALDGRNNLYIAETSLNELVMYPWSGLSYGAPEVLSSLGQPMGVAVSSIGNVYFTVDSGDLYVLDVADAPSLSFESTIEGSTSGDSPRTVTLENIGNAALTFAVPLTGFNPSVPQNFSVSPNATMACPSVSSGAASPASLAAGSACELAISFTPTTVGNLSGPISLLDNNLNAPSPAYTTQHIALSGIGMPKVPVIQWSTPSPITYGAPLTPAQLNATTLVAGSFIYSPPLGTILPAGQQGLSVVFTPNDTVNYTSASASVVLTVNQAVPSITWAAPAAITYGTTLSATQLDATSPLPGAFNYSPGFGATVSAGAQTLSVTFSPSDSNDYTTATATVPLTVHKAIPTLTWTPPAAITYGTTLSASQLDASSSVPGSFTYSPPAGSLFPAGTQTLSTTFNPTDTVDYTPASASVSLVVNKATPAINWAAPVAITYGTGLSGAQLNASSTVAGTFAYSPAAGIVLNAGQQTLSVTFTPTDTADYTTATGSVTLTVNQVTPTIVWAAPAPITYGTPLSAAQLTATSTVPGTFSYATPAGTVLSAGIQTLSVLFTPTDSVDYSTASASVAITVNKAVPPITWIPPAGISYGTPLSATQLDAGSSVPGTFTYTPAAGTILHAGSQTLKVSFAPSDSNDYTTTTASVSLTIVKTVPTLSWATPASINYGTMLSASQLNATSSAAGSFSYSSPTGTIFPAGTQTLSVTFTPNNSGDYTTATASVMLTINRAVPSITWATPLSIVYGTPLGATQLDASSPLPGTFSYSSPAGSVLAAGTQTLSVTFSPSDSADYTTATASVFLRVNKAQITVSWATPGAITYGTGLSAAQLDAQASIPGTFTYSPQLGVVLGAGTRTISVTFTPTDSNDYSNASASTVITVTKAVLTVSAENLSKVYAAGVPSLPFLFSGLVNNDSITQQVTGKPTLSTTATAGSQVGSYPIAIAPGSLAALNYTFIFVPGTLTVVPAVLEVTAHGLNKVYGAPLPTLTYFVTGYMNGDTSATAFTGAPSLSTTAAAASAVGTYPITASTGSLASLNYSFTFVQGTLTVMPAALSITANDQTSIYGRAIPGFTYAVSGLVSGDTASRAFGGSPSLTAPASQGSPAGTYPITAGIGTIVSHNYSLTFVSGKLIISKANLIVIPSNLSAVYGTGLPSFTYQITGFVNGDTQGSSVAGAPTLRTSGGPTPAVGTYPITGSVGTLSAANYSFGFETGTLTIKKASLTVTANTFDRVYGSALPALSYTVTGFAYADKALTSISGAPSLTTTATITSRVGGYPVTATLGTLSAANYTFTFVKGELFITQANLAVVVTNQNITYGSAIPALTYQFNGFVNGDTATIALHGAPSISTSATLTSSAGSYPIAILPGNLTATNYTFSFTPGVLTINKAVLTLTAINQSIVQGSPIPVFTYALSGFVSDESLANALSGQPSISTTATRLSTAGSYPIQVALGSLSAQNYSFSLVNGVLTITSANVAGKNDGGSGGGF